MKLNIFFIFFFFFSQKNISIHVNLLLFSFQVLIKKRKRNFLAMVTRSALMRRQRELEAHEQEKSYVRIQRKLGKYKVLEMSLDINNVSGINFKTSSFGRTYNETNIGPINGNVNMVNWSSKKKVSNQHL